MVAKKIPAPVAPPKKLVPSIFNFSVKIKYAIAALLALCFYANSLPDGYVLDDEALIQQNDYVQQGFSGIGKIMTKDAFDSYYKKNQANQFLTGGRYRPLSIVLFAIEHQLWGESPFKRHVVNVLLYILCVLSIFYFLRNYLCKKLTGGEDIAFISTVLFAIHPIHTEVVANIKSSDEILSLLFIMLTFIFSVKYKETRKIKNLIFALLALFSALLAKEYALTLIFLLPLFFMLYFKEKLGKSVNSVLPYLGIALLYIIIRFASIGLPHQHGALDILYDPYQFAKPVEKIASKIFALGEYLRMLIFPYPLAADYGFAQMPYSSFLSPLVWLSILVYSSIIYSGIKLFKNGSMISFAVFFFLFNLLPVANIFLNVGTTIGERLIFHSSLGFVIISSWGIVALSKKINVSSKKWLIMGSLSILVIVCGIETINRNNDWKSNYTLFTKDVNTVPNSILVNNKAGLEYVNLSETIKDTLTSDSVAHKGISYLRNAIRIDPSDLNAYLNLGIGYSQLIEPDSAKYFWDIAKSIDSEQPNLPGFYSLLEKILLYKGKQFAERGRYPQAVHEYEMGIQVNPANADIWYFLGGTFFNIHQNDSARYAWQQTARINPNYPNVNICLGMLPKQN